MRVLACCICCVAVLGACADTADDSDMTAGDTSALGTPPPAPGVPATGVSLAQAAGTWNVRGMAENSDSVLVTYTLVADADSSWSMKFDNRPDTIPVRVVAVQGDSIITEAGPYPSVLRQGVMVTTRGAFRIENDRLVGRTVARYTPAGADSVVIVRSEGTRVR